jgi:hypothetical protein
MYIQLENENDKQELNPTDDSSMNAPPALPGIERLIPTTVEEIVLSRRHEQNRMMSDLYNCPFT